MKFLVVRASDAVMVGVLALAHAMSACSGDSGLPSGSDDDAPGTEPTSVVSPTAGPSPLSPPSPTDGSMPSLDPGTKAMHRLNTAEYNATVRDVLGTTLEPANANWRGGEFAGFDNIASVLGMDEAQYDRSFNSARTLATEVFASEELRARFVACELSERACVRESIEGAGLRLFRRPLAPEELATYEKVYDAALGLGDEPLAALRLTFQALLSSAEFLFRIELDPQPDSTEPHPLSAFELAARLSFFLWSSAPDDALLALAADDSLLDPATLSPVVDRMLDDPRSERLVSNFSGQWLGARRVISHPVAPELYWWSPQVALAAADEMVLYFAEFLRTERSWFGFPTADINYVDGWLSQLYGMPTPLEMPERIEFTEDERAGFFGLAGFLAVTSFDRRTSPSLRGSWIANNLLCLKVPDPPPDVPKLEDAAADPATLDIRQVLERHRDDPACAGCHALFDPYGFALEEYDAIGRYRSAYQDGTPVDASSALPASAAHPEGRTVAGLDGLASAVASDPQFGKCLAKKLLTYGLGRVVTPTDEPYLEQAHLDWTAAGRVPSIRRLIHTLILTEPFRYRRGAGGPEEPL